MKLPDARALFIKSKLGRTPNAPGKPDFTTLILTVCEDKHGRVPFGMVGLDIAEGKTADERRDLDAKARQLEALIDELVVGITFQPL